MRRKTLIVGSKASLEQGFTYLILLVALIIVGILAEVTATLTSTAIQSEKEQQLLFAGSAYSRAISSFYHADPSRKRYPGRLEDLLIDPRFPMRKHIRKLYAEPMGANGEWVVIRNKASQIIGVSPNSEETPLKQAGFPQELDLLSEAKHYSEWRFLAAELKHAVAKGHIKN